MAGPARMTRKRRHAGWFEYAPGSASSTSSPGLMPAMRTYPPNGMAEKAHSVAPRRRRRSTGPKPTLNRSTRMPHARATAKWPSSWMRMSAPNPAATTRTTRKVLADEPKSEVILGISNTWRRSEKSPACLAAELLGGEELDLRVGIPPGVRREPRLEAGALEEGPRVPALLHRDARQERTSVPPELDHDAVAPHHELRGIAHGTARVEGRHVHVQIVELRGADGIEARVLGR